MSVNSSRTFWALVRQEIRLKGSWRKMNRTGIGKRWWLIYLVLIAVFGFGLSTYYAMAGRLQLNSIWSITAGVPYLFAVIGLNIVKREQENDTYGWWLTLPYSRMWLVGAKWIAAWVRLFLGVWAGYAIASIYVWILSFTMSHYTFADAKSFMLLGLSWSLLVVGIGPFILTLGILTACTRFSSLRPLTPVFTVLFMGLGSYAYWGLGTQFFTGGGYFMHQFSGDVLVNRFQFPWQMILTIAISLLFVYPLLWLSAYFLDRKISL